MNASIESTINRIREYQKASGLTKFRLSCLAGIAEGSLRRLDDDDWNPTADTLRAIEAIIPADFCFQEARKNTNESEPVNR